MDIPSTEILSVLNYLLPGLVATWAFRRLTPHDKPRDLEAVIEALLFTAAVQPVTLLTEWLAFLVGSHLFVWGIWTDKVAFVVSVILGLAIGLTSGIAANKDWIHKVFRRLNITKQTAYPSEWYRQLFAEERFVILTMKNGDRVMGWPAEFPNSSEKGHFNLTQASWLPAGEEPRQLTSAEAILIPAAEVLYLEFLKFEQEMNNE